MNPIKIYISHSIRGKYGRNATHEQMVENNNKAITFTILLKLNYPRINFYCPGEHDEFVMMAYEKKYLTEKQILDIDCSIIDTCNLVLNYSPDGFFSNGMQVENNHANLHNIPTITMKDTSQTEREKLERFLKSLMKG